MSINPGPVNQMQQALAQTVRDHWKMFLLEGIVLAVLGVLAIVVPQVATLAVAIFLGWLFLISGVLGLATTLMARQMPGFWWALISAAVAILAGILLLGWPVSGAVSLTLLLVAFFIVEGVASVMYALEHRDSGRWAWMLVSGIIDLVLAAMIFAGLPSTAEWALGLLVGINMLFGGTAMIAMALHARGETSSAGAPKSE
ncbi:MAG: HdeD family acid-resistance protein [Hyphomicrobiales bacterium]|nr:HdeD family acid-resistance protein [Hyphomicrobiales bacterium]